MPEQTKVGKGTIAPLKNVALALKAMDGAFERMAQREDGEPGMVCLYGPAGIGKSHAATYTMIKHRAYYVQVRSTWTKKDILSAIVEDMGIPKERTMSGLTGQIGRQLIETGRPLIVDEMDHVVKRDAVDIIRDLYDIAHVPIMLVGEEKLPDNLKKQERFHRRVFDWVPAQPADARDAKILAPFYARRIEISDDLLAEVASHAKGSLSRISVNLSRI